MTIRNVAGHYMTLTRPPISPAAAAATARDGNGKPMRVEGAASTQSDLMASNGVLHIIEQVLFHSSGTALDAVSLVLYLGACFFIMAALRSRCGHYIFIQ